MKVCLYRGMSSVVRRSGVGEAMRHQEAMLDHLGAERIDDLSEPFDVLHLNTVFPDSVAAGLLARARGARVVYFGHSTGEDFRDSWIGANAMAPLFGVWLKIAYSVGHVVVTPTPYSCRIISAYGTRRPVRTLSNGVDTDFFDGGRGARDRFRARYGLPAGQKVVMSVGHLMVRKGVTDFVELARRMPDVRFYWFGTAPKVTMPRTVRDAIDTAPENCRFVGFVPREEVRDAYAGADLFVFLSNEETEGIVVLEAPPRGCRCSCATSRSTTTGSPTARTSTRRRRSTGSTGSRRAPERSCRAACPISRTRAGHSSRNRI